MTEADTSAKMSPPKGGAVVRMYCTGLGDCFLIGFRARNNKTSYVMIDCGVWKGTPGATPWMKRIMEHIRDEVAGRGIELLVATHQHWDHLSGFSQARDVFDQIEVKQVWLPWTEDPEDRTAVKLAEDRRMAYRAALAAAGRLQGLAETDPNAADTMKDVMAILQIGDETPGAAAGMLGAGPSTEDLLEIVRKKAGDRPLYIRPGLTPRFLDSVPGVRIYPLGPPTDLKLLGRDDPSTVPGKSEVYLAGMPLNEDFAFFQAASASPAADGSAGVPDLARPFDRLQGKEPADPERSELFRSRYEDSRTAWRRIDTDWLAAAGQLALDLDDHVNNTSLALAFELGEGGPVLLFPGDAQVGNWLSWHELKSAEGLTAESLLNRTVLYKVGHHASHNATLKDKGLKMMTATSRLVAMIPVDEKEARKPKGRNKNGWAMPYDKLLADLTVRTEGRILRADRGLQDPGDGLKGAAKQRWKTFKRRHEFVSAETQVEIEKGRPETRTLFLQVTVEGVKP